MAPEWSSTSDNGERLYFDDTVNTTLRNQAYVLMSGTVGAFGELKHAAQEAVEHPGSTAVQMGTAAVLGGALGYLAPRAGVLGLAARGTAAALGVSFVFEGLKPIGIAMGRAGSARSTNQLDRIADQFSHNTGQILFNTLITAPFAIGGTFAGRGLRSTFAGEVASVSTAKTAPIADTAPQRPAATRSTTGAHRIDPRHTSTTLRPGRNERFGREPRVEVLEGELIDPPPRATTARPKPEMEIIDAEFTVIRTPEHSLTHGSSHLPLARLTDAPVVIVHQPTANQFSVMLRQDHPLSVGSALTELRRYEPAWSARSGDLVSPSPSRMTAEQIALILKNAYNHDVPRPGQIIDVTA